MKRYLVVITLALVSSPLLAQKVDSIFFHLYTDSLRKGQHNYINIDGKLSNGSWVPLSTKEIDLSCTSAKFEGNELVIPYGFTAANVIVKAVLKANPSIRIQRTIWIRQNPDPDLPTRNEIMQNDPGKKTKGKKD
jgi:hypothetical protein